MSRPAHHVIRGRYPVLDPLAIESYQTARRLQPEGRNKKGNARSKSVMQR
jgi:hypothetical protein